MFNDKDFTLDEQEENRLKEINGENFVRFVCDTTQLKMQIDNLNQKIKDINRVFSPRPSSIEDKPKLENHSFLPYPFDLFGL